MFFTNSNAVLGDIKFLKYFDGLSLSSFGSKGFVVTNGPTCIKSPRMAMNADIIRIGPIINKEGMAIAVNK